MASQICMSSVLRVIYVGIINIDSREEERRKCAQASIDEKMGVYVSRFTKTYLAY